MSTGHNAGATTGHFLATDADGSDTLTYQLVSTPNQGTVVNNNDGSFSFDPGSDFLDLQTGESRTVSFSYQVVDSSNAGNATSATQTVTITVSNALKVLFVSDSGVGAEMATVLENDGHSVTSVLGDFNGATTPALEADLSALRRGCLGGQRHGWRQQPYKCGPVYQP